jgi:hypothetical protein
VSWSPECTNFIADTGGHTSSDLKTGTCLGSGTSCQVFPDLYAGFDPDWSGDGTAVIVAPGFLPVGSTIDDFTDASSTSVYDRLGDVDQVRFLGTGSERLLVNVGNAKIWDRRTDKVTRIFDHGTAYSSPTGRYLLFRGLVPETWRYLDPASPSEAAATFRGTNGYWTEDGSSFVGVGPASAPNRDGCSSLRQWSPATTR